MVIHAHTRNVKLGTKAYRVEHAKHTHILTHTHTMTTITPQGRAEEGSLWTAAYIMLFLHPLFDMSAIAFVVIFIVFFISFLLHHNLWADKYCLYISPLYCYSLIL